MFPYRTFCFLLITFWPGLVVGFSGFFYEGQVGHDGTLKGFLEKFAGSLILFYLVLPPYLLLVLASGVLFLVHWWRKSKSRVKMRATSVKPGGR